MLLLRAIASASVVALATGGVPQAAFAEPPAGVAKASAEVAVPFTSEEMKWARLFVVLWKEYNENHSPVQLLRAAYAYCQFCPRRVNRLMETLLSFPEPLELMNVLATCLHEPPPAPAHVRKVLGLPP
jgi:hypothetical protein